MFSSDNYWKECSTTCFQTDDVCTQSIHELVKKKLENCVKTTHTRAEVCTLDSLQKLSPEDACGPAPLINLFIVSRKISSSDKEKSLAEINAFVAQAKKAFSKVVGKQDVCSPAESAICGVVYGDDDTDRVYYIVFACQKLNNKAITLQKLERELGVAKKIRKIFTAKDFKDLKNALNEA